MSNIIEIPLTRGAVAIIDAEDYPLVSQYKWYASWKSRKKDKLYAANKRKSVIYMHRLIMGDACLGLLVDHKNGDTLDNRRANLRTATFGQNSANRRKPPSHGHSSKYKGVWWNKEKQKWSCEIRLKAGNFDREEDAALAYNIYAEMLHGRYASLNPVPHFDESPLQVPLEIRKVS